VAATVSSAHQRVADLLAKHHLKVVFAESCTAGLASAMLAKVPGISEHHCGGMVVYRNATKQQYLGISSALLARHSAVSEPVAREMAIQILKRTPEADVSAAVTGHLGPNAPADQDGLVFIAIARRHAKRIMCDVSRFKCDPKSNRQQRQKEAAEAVLERLSGMIDAIATRRED
jgi:nicotinamide-nucleotide amidase